MKQETITYLAAAFELGLPLLLIGIAIFRPLLKMWVAVVLGALTPILLSFAGTSVFALVLKQEEAIYSFLPMWDLSLIPYIACAVFGAVLGLLPVPRSGLWRYIMGLLPPAIAAIAWAVITKL